ncbi:MAG: polyribonucleotide nucleotidyltransferase, partial [Deltaproteobacteria bacterium]|nr:polyribonucleotide nucleotidyltransferase [Deltaproteobacteria bacterium]
MSDIPFGGPLAGIRVGRIEGQWVMNPTQSQLQTSDVNVFISGTRNAIVMVEGGALMVPEDAILEGLFRGHEAVQRLLDVQDEIKREVGKPKRPVPAVEKDESLSQRIRELAQDKLKRAIEIQDKLERYGRFDALKSEVISQALIEYPEREKEIAATFEELKREHFRRLIIQERRRSDGRGLKDVRPIACEVQVLPRTHGSAIFTRGETQALVVTTLGTASDEQKIDALIGEHYKKFMLH